MNQDVYSKEIDKIDFSCWKTKRNIPRINEEIYTLPELKNIGAITYNNFDDIKGGNIIYYKDRFVIEDMYAKPNFVNNHRLVSIPYKDPMNSNHFIYTRLATKNNVSDQLSFIQDTNEIRENYISLILRKHNRNAYNSKWNVY